MLTLKVPRVLPSRRTRLLPVSLIAASALLAGTVRIGAASPAATSDPLLETMQRELKRATTDLAKSDPPPYFIGYTVTDLDASAIVATNGSLIFTTNRRIRMADVMMRVGTTALDNTHGQARGSGIVSGQLPLDNDTNAIARVLWQLTNREYDQASSAFLKVKTSTAVQSEEEDKSPDFSSEKPQSHVSKSFAPADTQQKVWEERVRKTSAGFLKYPEVYSAIVSLQTSNDRTPLANS